MQPARRAYDYCDPHNCMLCQYFTAMGFQDVSITFNNMVHSGGRTKFPREFSWDIANGADRTDTYGAALKRARALTTHD